MCTTKQVSKVAIVQESRDSTAHKNKQDQPQMRACMRLAYVV